MPSRLAYNKIITPTYPAPLLHIERAGNWLLAGLQPALSGMAGPRRAKTSVLATGELCLPRKGGTKNGNIPKNQRKEK